MLFLLWVGAGGGDALTLPWPLQSCPTPTLVLVALVWGTKWNMCWGLDRREPWVLGLQRSLYPVPK